MRIIACFKAVPDNDHIGVNPDRSISVGGEFAAGQYDFNAIEAAARLKAECEGSTVAVLTVCADEDRCTSKIKKAVLSRGADELYAVVDPALKGADALVTAQALAAAVRKIGADLVVCGEGSGDMYAQQTGVVLGSLLGWPTLNAVCGLSLCAGGVAVKRMSENETEEYELSLPAAIAVTSDINVPRIASLKEIMAAGRKPSTVWSAADLGAELKKGRESLSTLAPRQTDRRRDIVKGEDAEAVAALYEKLRRVL